MDVLVGLPTEVTSLIVSEWLELRDVGLLDSAYLNHAMRNHLLTSLTSPQCVLVGWPKLQRCDKYVQWICLRGIRVENIIVTNTSVFTLCRMYMERFGQFVKRIKARQGENLKEKLLFGHTVICCKLCVNLSELHCERQVLSNTIFDVLRSCPKLEILRFTKCSSISDEVVDPRACEHLQNVRLKVFEDEDCSSFTRCMIAILISVAPHSIEKLGGVCDFTVLGRHRAQFTNLKALRVPSLLGENGLKMITKRAPHIVHLDLARCAQPLVGTVFTAFARRMRQLKTLKISYSSGRVIAQLMHAFASRRVAALEVLYTEYTANGHVPEQVMEAAFHSFMTRCSNIKTLSCHSPSNCGSGPSSLFKSFAAVMNDAAAKEHAELPCLQHLEHLRCSVDRASFMEFDFTRLTAQRLPALRTLVLVFRTVGEALAANPSVAALQAMRPDLHITSDATALPEYDIMKLTY